MKINQGRKYHDLWYVVMDRKWCGFAIMHRLYYEACIYCIYNACDGHYSHILHGTEKQMI